VRQALEAAGYPVQTLRLAGPALARAFAGEAQALPEFARRLETACRDQGFDYTNLGPAWPTDPAEYFSQIPEALGATQTVFASASLTDAHGLSLLAARRVAEIIHRCATLTPDGFGNLRFAALAQVPPGAPFFPAAYHRGGAAQFALGLEAADLAVTAAQAADPLAARADLVRAIETHAAQMQAVLPKISARFAGFDFTLAPFPDAARSLGGALERLSGARVGEAGTLAAAAFWAEAVDRAQYPRAGFNGLFFPVFEDEVLARRAAEGLLAINDLLLYATVCGSGLDTVPLPGEVAPAALAAILADVGALALRLRKPLTARLMPIPGKQAGDEVAFDFAYFAPTRVLRPSGAALGGLLARAETLGLQARHI
jgi:hypothetical protein